ncbi:MAG: leucine--tRNA ligase [Candidatus Pacebacteria bacterium]|nr:leucine--tRNA ligase [Candidatus Paceibacterota bacterium]NUQ57544.1 leucine--tRNA ligase [Candidatus Paceibacter sp.]
MRNYDPKKTEKKWQKYWKENGIYNTKEDPKNPKCYVLDMFPYPSGEGLHVGHPKGYIATDVYSRFKKMSGYNILHPMGWDAFGLPAENYAIKNKIHPKISTDKNIKRFKKQIERIGFNYDWDREINTTDPEYYKWTQWIFLKMFEKGLAYQSYEPINWCPSCQTGLANEDVEDGKCERCGTPVIKKSMRQWVLKITDYAERLLEDLNKLNWPEHIKESQRNWIGKSEGATIKFKVGGSKFSTGDLEVFTTRVDTIFGVTYVVLSPEHPLIQEYENAPRPAGEMGITNFEEVKKYAEESKNKTDLQRTNLVKEKTGVELKGIKAINPANGEELPVWVADYVLASYGTGAVMAVPTHDERDAEFAKKYNLPVSNAALIGKDEAIKISGGKKTIKYKLRDWVFSRQRYWGEPIPLVHCDNCGVVPVPEKDLPVKLPKVKFYEPTGTGESPLATINKWVNTKCPKCGGKAKRETNTMPQWAGSSWYYLRYADPKNSEVFADKEKEKYWMPVDVYVGGAEHATRHLIYARFWHKFLYDIGEVSGKEPFMRLHNVGLVTAEDGRKMSKRWGNVINPDDVVEKWGADTLRMYEMFMGPFEQAIPWSEKNLIGLRRFLASIFDYVYGWKENYEKDVKADSKNKELYGRKDWGGEISADLNKTIKKVSEDIENFKFNTAISSLMIFFNLARKELPTGLVKSTPMSIPQMESFIKLLAPFAPHLAEEIWQGILGHKTSIHLEKWPVFDEEKIKEKTFKLVVQIDGKTRDVFEAPAGISEEEARVLTLKRENVKKYVNEKGIEKIIFVPDKIISIITRP